MYGGDYAVFRNFWLFYNGLKFSFRLKNKYQLCVLMWKYLFLRNHQKYTIIGDYNHQKYTIFGDYDKKNVISVLTK